MDPKTDTTLVIEAHLLEELKSFEAFFSKIGFKRIDGSVFGLLVMAKRPLTSEEIEETLKLSQSAVSLSLKSLAHFGAIETSGDRDLQYRDLKESKARFHSAKEDSLAIVASVLKKREQDVVADFKKMAQRVLAHSGEEPRRQKRMESMIATCELAESVMNLVLSLVEHKGKTLGEAQYQAVIKKLPKSLDFLATTGFSMADMTLAFKDSVTEKLKNHLGLR